MAIPPPRPDPRGIPDVPDRALAQPPESLADLALRIEMAELRVVRRDLEFRLHLDSLQHRGKAVLVPSRWLLPALGTGASWLFWRLVRRRPKGHRGEGRHRDDHAHRQAHGHGHGSAHAHSAHHAPHAHGPGGPFGRDPGESSTQGSSPHAHQDGGGHLQLLTMLWGLVPLSLRGRVHPEIAQLLMGVVAGYLQGRKEQRAAAHPADTPAASGSHRAAD
ncbi:hypothetical protein [Roseateles chitosanitabidus]|uniref:hypothetical protein n=1 Tax=Roseateles chitosanitabidus TaxID=65048 RepID=UPI00082CAB83|nr:hypothetical protein [Roseateles chitosanitabidus]